MCLSYLDLNIGSDMTWVFPSVSCELQYEDEMLRCYTPRKRSLGGYIGITPSVCLSVRLSVRPSVQSKLNLGYNFSTNRDKAFILHMLVPCDKTFLSVPKNLTLWPWPWLLTYFWKNLTLVITFQPIEIRLSYYTCLFLVTRPFCPYQNFWPCDLDLILKKLNLGYNFWTERDKAFILQVCIPCGMTFLSMPKILTLWPWSWLLTYFWKNLTFAITFDPREIRLSYYRYVFLVAWPFCPCQKIWPYDLDLDFWPTFEKT